MLHRWRNTKKGMGHADHRPPGEHALWRFFVRVLQDTHEHKEPRKGNMISLQVNGKKHDGCKGHVASLGATRQPKARGRHGCGIKECGACTVHGTARRAGAL
jgi:hypothetical protein